eukprot:6179367-Pleurochrysis_carterae.AAC.1
MMGAPATGAGMAGGAACTPMAAPASIMSDVMLASLSSMSGSSARAPSVGTTRARPDTNVEGGLW